MPFIATREGYRREGNCKRLIKVRSPLQTRCAAQKLQATAVPAATLVDPLYMFLHTEMLLCIHL
jgi:hypothetical protein